MPLLQIPHANLLVDPFLVRAVYIKDNSLVVEFGDKKHSVGPFPDAEQKKIMSDIWAALEPYSGTMPKPQ
ncbi:MAG: hypothetical protein WC712_02570 [Candidatus Brocadiia bacterium]